MKVLLTGAAGWLARAVAAELASHGHELHLMDCVAPGQATIFVPGKLERIKQPLKTRWPYTCADITDLAAMCKAARGVDAVIHLAAITDGLPEHGKRIMEINAVGTYVVLDAARLSGVQRVLAASSINAFGTFAWRLSGKPPVYESMPLEESFVPVVEDPYSLSKLCNEMTCAAFSRAYGLTTAALRFAGVWTPEMYEQRRANMVPTAAWEPGLYQWVHVADIAAGIRQALESPNLPVSGVYTLGAADTTCPEPTMDILRRFRPDLAATLRRPLVGRAPLLSIELARRTFGYAPRYRLVPEKGKMVRTKPRARK